MSVDQLVLVQGWDHTRVALERWSRAPWRALQPWIAVSAAIACGLLLGVYAIAAVSQPDPSPLYLPGYHGSAGAADYLSVLYRNSLVLALHALACVAGFMAGSSLPLSASQRTGASRWIHEKAGPLAIVFVTGATLFSLCTQTYVIGGGAATLANQLGLPPAVLVVGLLPHALPELVALFLPLAAWLLASRRGAWDELLAATFVTVAVAVPVLLASAAVELWVTPDLLRLLAG